MTFDVVNANQAHREAFVTAGFMAARLDERGRYCDWHSAPSLQAASEWAEYMMAKTGQVFVAGECRSARAAGQAAA